MGFVILVFNILASVYLLFHRKMIRNQLEVNGILLFGQNNR